VLHDLIANPRAAQLHHGAALKDAIRACVDTALLSQVRDACHRGGLALLSVAAQRRISELSVGTCPVCNRADVEVSGGKLRSHLRRPGDTDGGACLGSGEAPTAAPVVEAFVEGEHATAARLGWTLEVIHDLGGRSEQQDRWSVAEVDGALLALVADGMGGHSGGAQAAETAARVFVETARKHGATLNALRSALYAADAALAPHQRRAPGTTLTALFLTADAAYLCHAGDSAALRWDGGGWSDIAIRHGVGNIVDLCLGGSGLESSEVAPQLEKVSPSDVWLLCSDGLVPDVGSAGLWSTGTRRRLMPPDFEPGFLPAALAAAREAGSTDNATAVLLYRVPAKPCKPTPEEDRTEAARELAAWTMSEPAAPVDPETFDYATAEGEPVKMSCPLCGEMVDARRWRMGRPLYALQRHGTCSQIGRELPTAAQTTDEDRQDVKPPEVPASVSALLDRLAPEPAIAPPLTPRQADLLARLLDVQSVSFEARQLLDEPRWADTGEPVEDDAPLLREALRLEAEGKHRSSYIADFERKLALLNDGRRLPKRGREAAVVEREPVNDEPLAGEEMPEVEAPRSFEDLWTEGYPDGAIPSAQENPSETESDADAQLLADAALLGAIDRRRGVPRHLCPFVGARRDNWLAEWDACDEDMCSGLPDAVGWVPILGEPVDFDALPHPIATPEPDPIEGTGDVWAEVIADTEDPALRALFEARRQFGIDKYGRPLQRNNGRAHPNDLRQEIADGVVYARAADMSATEAVLTALLAGGEDVARALLNRENEDGISLLEYQNQIDDIADYLDAIDPHNDARDEDHTTAQQVIAILRRVVGQGDLSAALKPHPPCDGLAVEIVELGGVEPHVMLGARISRETAQRLGRSPGLYGKVTVLLPADVKETP